MRRRIVLAILLAVAVTAAALGVPLAYTTARIVESTQRDSVATRAQQIATFIDEDVASNRPVDLDRARIVVPDDGLLTVLRPGKPPLHYGRPITEGRVVEEVPTAGDGTVRLEIPDGSMRAQQTQVLAIVGLLVVLSIGIGAVVATVTARRLVAPLTHVASRAAKLGAGDFRPDDRRYRVPELDMVAEALDDSGIALAQLVQRERQLVGDVSHQLRSRLTALQLRLEALTEHPDQETAEEARAAQSQADQLAAVLDDLLAAARAARAIGAKPVDLHEELERISGEWRELFRARGRSLRVRVAEGLMASATPGRLSEAVGVLLDNALRHGAGVVTVSARKGENEATAVIEVTDAGDGVPDELAAHVFERGVSGVGSTGVGLALARALVDADGGRLELSSKRPATFSVFLRIPRASDVRGVSWPTDPAPR
ncbi:signal transduction histidine kinase [Tamaricihabitans halophyticus]|uniref:Signal transduction histidine-protein kinase/phosphatase MprB n=1 Tax=Tamaricihabitans halophyticus TaxID=1262583 RepID=A0A4R2R0H2_9PSEU|nr:ATP-binding protein [Tamaricihabitans halophyticus]TCP56120.1 signal transduction histidine kinase [Tamaricihabitans halophyticus]